MKKMYITLYTLLLLICSAELHSQSATNFNQRDDQYRLLGLKRAKAVYESARADFKRAENLFSKKLISEQEYLRTKHLMTDAEVNYQQSLLAVIFEEQYVSVVEAVKYQSSKGNKHVRLTLANTSGSAEYNKLININDELFRSLQPDVVNDVYVSLLNNDDAIISQPYEYKIETLKFGKPITINFALLQDVDMVKVNIAFSNGKQRTPKIYLQKDNRANKVLVQSEQFSQEVELGNSTIFDLSLELFSGNENTFKLETVNLPNQITRYFIDPTNNARLSQFKFTERTNSRIAGLQVFLPERPTADIEIGKTIPFYILVIPGNRQDIVKKNPSKIWSQEEIEKLNVGYVKLELIPRGVGKILVQARQLYHAIQPGNTVPAKLVIRNEGSRRLNNIKIETDLPLNWKSEMRPDVIESLDIGQEKTVELSFIPAQDVSVGRYEIRVRSTALTDDRAIDGEDKTYTVEILSESNILGTLLIVLLIIGTIGGIVIFGIRLTRR